MNNDELETLELPGVRRQTVGGHKQGVKTMEVWLQTMAPGADTARKEEKYVQPARKSA